MPFLLFLSFLYIFNTKDKKQQNEEREDNYL